MLFLYNCVSIDIYYQLTKSFSCQPFLYQERVLWMKMFPVKGAGVPIIKNLCQFTVLNLNTLSIRQLQKFCTIISTHHNAISGSPGLVSLLLDSPIGG